MIYPSADKLESWGSRYALVVLAAKRAKQLKSGASPLIQTDSRNALTVALEEIAAGRITCVVADTDLPPVAVQLPEIAQLLAIPEPEPEEVEAEPAAAVDEQVAPVESKPDEEEEIDEEEVEEEEEEEEEDLLLGDDGELIPLVSEDDQVEIVPEVAAEPKRGRRASKAEPDIDIEPIADIVDIDDTELAEDEPEEE